MCCTSITFEEPARSYSSGRVHGTWKASWRSEQTNTYEENRIARNWIEIKDPDYSQKEGLADWFKRAGSVMGGGVSCGLPITVLR